MRKPPLQRRRRISKHATSGPAAAALSPGPPETVPTVLEPCNSGEAHTTSQHLHPPRWVPWAAAILIASLGACLYWHTLGFPFQFDDHIYLLGSPFIKDMGDFVFERDFHDVATCSERLGLGMDPSVNFILRPFAYLTFHLNYLVGGFEPAGYRAVNIAVHCANAVLLFVLLSHLLRRAPGAVRLSCGSVVFIPLTAAFLFVAHPLHTESVTYIVQRFTSLVGLFVLLSLYLHLLSLSVTDRRAALILRGASFLTTLAGMLTKESMFTAPLLMVVLHVVVLGGSLKRACWQALPQLLCMLIIPSLVLLTSRAQSGGSSLGAALHIAASIKDPGYRYHYFLTQLAVVIEYVRLILWPAELNVDREYPLATSALEPRVWLSAMAVLALVLGSWWWHRMRRNSIRHALICGAVSWYFLRLAVSSSFVPLDDLMVEHRTYGASMGLLTAVACCLDLVRTHRSRWLGFRWAVPAAAVAGIALLSVATLNRNDIWQSEASLWNDTVLKSPGKARPWDNLAVTHHHQGRREQALACLAKAVEVDSRYAPAYVKLGILLNASGRFGDAATWSRRGLAVLPAWADLHYNLGVALCGLGRLRESMDAMQETVNLMPSHAPAHVGLGQLHRHYRHYKRALQHYRLAVSLGSEDPDVKVAVNQLEQLVGPQHVAN